MNKVTVSKLDRAEYSGDWHDKPLKWIVKTGVKECQKFSTKKDADFYAKLRRHNSEREAMKLWMNSY